ncbi:PDR/VanB family oxidoreductase [Nocardioides ultimimeridianus]
MKMRIRSRSEVADGVVHLVMEAVGGGDLPSWQPGAHVDVRIAEDLVRQYSLCGDPRRRDVWEIGVLRVADGRGGSICIHDDLVDGATVEVVGPRNHFALEPAPAYLFIAGGIGITPILPMVREAEAGGADWHLAYGGRTRSSMAFASDLLERYADRVVLAPQDECGLLDLSALLGPVVPGRRIYACGPEPLLVSLEAAMARRDGETLHLERFSPKELPASTGGSFEVEASASGVDVTVEEDESIIDALQRVGVSVDFSCREGTCGTCEVAVLDGVPEHRDSVLTPEEQAENDCMMICVGRCLQGPLVLDI